MLRPLLVAPLALVAACKASPGPPVPRLAASASFAPGPSSAPPPPPAEPTSLVLAYPEPVCQKGPGHYGGWTPSGSDVAAIVPALRDGDCGAPAWRGPALERCMKEQGQSSVTVRYEAEIGPDHRAFACWLGVTGVEWKGRRFLVVHDRYFETPTAWGYTNVYEVTRAGPVLFLDGVQKHAPLCQVSNPSPTAATPPGWSAFPKDLQEVLCGP